MRKKTKDMLISALKRENYYVHHLKRKIATIKVESEEKSSSLERQLESKIQKVIKDNIHMEDTEISKLRELLNSKNQEIISLKRG